MEMQTFWNQNSGHDCFEKKKFESLPAKHDQFIRTSYLPMANIAPVNIKIDNILLETTV